MCGNRPTGLTQGSDVGGRTSRKAASPPPQPSWVWLESTADSAAITEAGRLEDKGARGRWAVRHSQEKFQTFQDRRYRVGSWMYMQ